MDTRHEFPQPARSAADLRSPLRYLLWLIRCQPRPMTAAAVFGITCTLAQALIPVSIGLAIDNGLRQRDQRQLLWYGGAVLLLGVVQAVAGMLRDRASVRNRFGASYRTMQMITAQAARLGAELERRTSTGDIVSVGASDITRLGIALESTARGSGAVVSIVVAATIMVSLSWQLGMIVIVGIPLMAFVLAHLMRPLHRRQAALRDRQGALTGVAVDIVGGLRILRGIGGEAVFARRYRELSQQLRREGVQVAAVAAWVQAARVLIPGLLTATIVWLGAVRVDGGDLSAGLLVTFYAYAVFNAEQLRRTVFMIDQLTRAHVAAGRVVTLLSMNPTLPTGPRPLGDLARTSTLTDPESGLTIAAGSLTGVACEGDTEADRLADRLGWYADTAVTLDGTPLAEFARGDVRRRILVAGNDGRLFSGRLRAEIDPHGVTDGNDRAFWDAVDAVSARDILDALTDGVDTDVVGAGREFSGGQLQRLRLARALLADADVLILVEPSNAVDAHTEHRIAIGLRSGRAGRTTVVLTTSPVLLGKADSVSYVAGGRVVATGVHQGLLDDHRYRRLVSREVAAA